MSINNVNRSVFWASFGSGSTYNDKMKFNLKVDK